MASSKRHDPETMALLDQIQSTLHTIQQDYKNLSSTIESINGRVNVLAGVQEIQDAVGNENENENENSGNLQLASTTVLDVDSHPDLISPESNTILGRPLVPRVSGTSRIILTTHPGQSGIDPIPMRWGHKDPSSRGPVVVSRSQSTFRRRNGKPRCSYGLIP